MAAPITTSIKLDPDLKARVQRLAEARQRSTHWLLLRAVAEYVEREEKREQFRAAGLAAWAQYQATGQYVDAARADAWLAKLEAGRAGELPGCQD